MIARLYNNISDDRYLTKTIYQQGGDVNIEIIDDTTIIKPTIKLRDREMYMRSNYIYIPDLRRYYFIRSIQLSQGYAYLSCEVDVLMTWKDAIKNTDAIVSRQQKKEHYNLYQIDNKMKLLNFPSLRCIEFSNGFEANKQEFILGVVGDTGN